MFRVPIFTWNMVVTGILILIAFPVLTAALDHAVVRPSPRHAHLLGRPAAASRCSGRTSSGSSAIRRSTSSPCPSSAWSPRCFPVFSRKPLFGYKGMVFATISIAALSTAVWAHHMFTTGVVLLPFFSLMSYLIAVPTGIKFFNWIGTMWRGSVKFDTPMLFAIGFLVVFLFGGVTGIFLASPPIDFATHDTYFVVAHFHEVLFGSAVFGGFAGIYYWYPKMTGRMLREGLGKASFWFMFVGFWVTFLPQYLLGLHGMPRRIAEYSATHGWTTLNRVSTVGAYMLFIAVAIMVVNFYVSWRTPGAGAGEPVGRPTLEWATTSPPPHHNFIRSRRSARSGRCGTSTTPSTRRSAHRKDQVRELERAAADVGRTDAGG